MNWSQMLPELLVKIAHQHIWLYEDRFAFSSVCNSWHSAAITNVPNSNDHGPSSGFPALLLAEKTNDNEFREFFLLSNKKTHKRQLREAYGKLCMSSKGLLVTVGNDYTVKLINPLSHETVNLPSLDTFPESLESLDWERGIWKLVIPTLSSGIVVVLWGSSSGLGFCRHGDNKWTNVVNGWDGRIIDITYYNNRVYCFDINYNIRMCDIYGDNPIVIDMVSKLPQELYNGYDDNRAYIVGCDDDNNRRRLLVLIRETTYSPDDDDDGSDDDDDEISYMTKGFSVFGYDIETETWTNVKDLGRKSVFVGNNSTFWMEDASGVIKGNCIYYTDDGLEQGRDMGIYHMSDGTIEPHYEGESLSKLTPPLWLEKM